MLMSQVVPGWVPQESDFGMEISMWDIYQGLFTRGTLEISFVEGGEGSWIRYRRKLGCSGIPVMIQPPPHWGSGA